MRETTGTDVAMRNTSPSRVDSVSPAKAVAKPACPSPLAQAGLELVTTVSASRPALVPHLIPVTAFTLHRVPEDQVGASKEVLIQVKLMNEWLGV